MSKKMSFACGKGNRGITIAQTSIFLQEHGAITSNRDGTAFRNTPLTTVR
jgi:hypothetical protein